MCQLFPLPPKIKTTTAITQSKVIEMKNLHSHNLKFHLIETMVRLAFRGSNVGSNGADTGLKSCEALRNGVKSFHNDTLKC